MEPPRSRRSSQLNFSHIVTKNHPPSPYSSEYFSMCSSRPGDSVSVIEMMHLSASFEHIGSPFERKRFSQLHLRNLYLRHPPPSVNPSQSAIENFERLSSPSWSSNIVISASNYRHLCLQLSLIHTSSRALPPRGTIRPVHNLPTSRHIIQTPRSRIKGIPKAGRMASSGQDIKLWQFAQY